MWTVCIVADNKHNNDTGDELFIFCLTILHSECGSFTVGVGRDFRVPDTPFTLRYSNILDLISRPYTSLFTEGEPTIKRYD